jgi:hypothetical protein
MLTRSDGDKIPVHWSNSSANESNANQLPGSRVVLVDVREP